MNKQVKPIVTRDEAYMLTFSLSMIEFSWIYDKTGYRLSFIEFMAAMLAHASKRADKAAKIYDRFYPPQQNDIKHFVYKKKSN